MLLLRQHRWVVKTYAVAHMVDANEVANQDTPRMG